MAWRARVSPRGSPARTYRTPRHHEIPNRALERISGSPPLTCLGEVTLGLIGPVQDGVGGGGTQVQPCGEGGQSGVVGAPSGRCGRAGSTPAEPDLPELEELERIVGMAGADQRHPGVPGGIRDAAGVPAASASLRRRVK
jgi:hypothetical protein